MGVVTCEWPIFLRVPDRGPVMALNKGAQCTCMTIIYDFVTATCPAMNRIALVPFNGIPFFNNSFYSTISQCTTQ